MSLLVVYSIEALKLPVDLGVVDAGKDTPYPISDRG